MMQSAQNQDAGLNCVQHSICGMPIVLSAFYQWRVITIRENRARAKIVRRFITDDAIWFNEDMLLDVIADYMQKLIQVQVESQI